MSIYHFFPPPHIFKPAQLKVGVYCIHFLCKSFHSSGVFFFSFSLSAPVLQISVSKVLLGSLPNFRFDSAHCLRFHRLLADVSTCCRALLLLLVGFFACQTAPAQKGVRKSPLSSLPSNAPIFELLNRLAIFPGWPLKRCDAEGGE